MNLFVAAPGNDVNVVNLSARAPVGTGDNILIPGITIAGSGTRDFLIRAIGPTLSNYGVAGALADPRLTLIRDGAAVAVNDDWQSQPNANAVETAIKATGAFPLAPGGKDAAMLASLAVGGYTAKIEGVANGTGVGMLEVYDVTAAAGSATLSNIAVRAVAGSGDDVLVVGIVMRGGGARRFLIRGVGPGLTPFGVSGALSDPQMSLFMQSVQTPLAMAGALNADPMAADLDAAAKVVGGFPLSPNDTAMIPRLVAGNYSVVLSSKTGGSGAAMIELYVLP